MPGKDNWVDELRVLGNRRYDHEGDRGEGKAVWNWAKSPLFLYNVFFNQEKSNA